MLKVFDGKDLVIKRDRPFVVRDTHNVVDPVYVSRDKQIASFIRSGEKLRSFRSSFEYPNGEVPEDAKPDPTLDIGFDYADASALAAHLAKKGAFAASEAKQHSATDAAEAAKESSPSSAEGDAK